MKKNEKEKNMGQRGEQVTQHMIMYPGILLPSRLIDKRGEKQEDDEEKGDRWLHGLISM